nr:ABC transporter permease [Acidobacteriota bacterium]
MSLVAQMRQVVRGLGRTPGFTVVAVGTLALGIGATVALFSVVDAVLLRPLPYRDADRLVVLGEKKPCCEFAPTSAGNFLEYRRRLGSLEDVAAFIGRSFTLAGRDGPVQLRGQVASPELFAALGTPAALGRVLSPQADRAGGPRA